jgi:hypothetical protein
MATTAAQAAIVQNQTVLIGLFPRYSLAKYVQNV